MRTKDLTYRPLSHVKPPVSLFPPAFGIKGAPAVAVRGKNIPWCERGTNGRHQFIYCHLFPWWAMGLESVQFLHDPWLLVSPMNLIRTLLPDQVVQPTTLSLTTTVLFQPMLYLSLLNFAR